jgi:hypothetical protein
MKQFTILAICFIALVNPTFGKDNRINFALGYPDLIGIEYQHNFNKIYVACSPHLLVSYLMTRSKGDLSYIWIIVPSFSMGYYFINKMKFDLALDLLIMPGLYSQRIEQTIQNVKTEEIRLDLATGLRLIPSFKFSRFVISIGGGLFLGNTLIKSHYYSTKQNVVYPSAILKLGINIGK